MLVKLIYLLMAMGLVSASALSAPVMSRDGRLEDVGEVVAVVRGFDPDVGHLATTRTQYVRWRYNL